eukprot:4680480-Alexandrium_andersonii.AAC.1
MVWGVVAPHLERIPESAAQLLCAFVAGRVALAEMWDNRNSIPESLPSFFSMISSDRVCVCV